MAKTEDLRSCGSFFAREAKKKPQLLEGGGNLWRERKEREQTYRFHLVETGGTGIQTDVNTFCI